MECSKNLVILTAFLSLGVVMCQYATPDPLCPYPSDEITFFPYPTNCSKYYECFEGTKYTMECPENLFWNQYTSSCDYVCNGTKPTSTTKRPTPDHDCPETGSALLPNYADCTRFFQCINGAKYPEVCPDGYAFSIIVQACQIKSTVDCSYTTLKPTSTTRNPNRRCPDNGLSYLPDYGDCTKYYQCFQGTETQMTCEDGQAWSIPISACDVREYVDCSYTTIFPPTPNPNNECPATGTSFLPHAYDCSLFYECINGVKHLLHCPNGYRWSIALNSCELEAYVDCGYTSRNPTQPTQPTPPTNPPTRSSTNPPDPGNSCNGIPNGTMLPHPTDCHKYIECDNGKERDMECAPGTTFDPNLDVCDNNDAENCKRFELFK